MILRDNDCVDSSGVLGPIYISEFGDQLKTPSVHYGRICMLCSDLWEQTVPHISLELHRRRQSQNHQKEIKATKIARGPPVAPPESEWSPSPRGTLDIVEFKSALFSSGCWKMMNYLLIACRQCMNLMRVYQKHLESSWLGFWVYGSVLSLIRWYWDTRASKSRWKFNLNVNSTLFSAGFGRFRTWVWKRCS